MKAGMGEEVIQLSLILEQTKAQEDWFGNAVGKVRSRNRTSTCLLCFYQKVLSVHFPLPQFSTKDLCILLF
jgi:hypothetical protein